MAIKQLGAAPTNPQDAVPKSYVDTETTRAQVAEALAALKANNLSDLPSSSTARTNLGLGGAAILAVGTTAGTVAAGNDSRFYPPSSLSNALPASPVVGQRVFVTDLAQEWLFNGTVWVVSVAGPTDTGWTAVTYTNGWVTASSVVQYRRVGTSVSLRGEMKTGTMGAIAFNLPVGYRPAHQSNYATSSNFTFGSITITSGGGCYPEVGSNIAFGVDGINFDTAA